MNNYWLSWYHPPDLGFELHWPWWVSGICLLNNTATICAAVQAKDDAEAKAIIKTAMNEPTELEWRFCLLQDDNWAPFIERFPQEDWMKWPINI